MGKNTPTHRGRVQAQGGGVEKSCSWAQAVHIYPSTGRRK